MWWDTAKVHKYFKITGFARYWHVALDGVVDMGVHVGYEANDSSLKHSSPVYGVSIFFIYYTVNLSCSTCNFTERNNLLSADVT